MDFDNVEVIDATFVLHAYLDLREYRANVNEWKNETNDRVQSCYYKYKILQVLFNVFELGEPEKFEDGDFAENRDLRIYTVFIDTLKNKMGIKLFENRRPVGHDEVQHFFTYLLDYRIIIQKAIYYNTRLIFSAGNYLPTHAARMISETNCDISDKIISIDQILAEIISPDQKKFNKHDLIQHYGYPDKNIGLLELDDL